MAPLIESVERRQTAAQVIPWRRQTLFGAAPPTVSMRRLAMPVPLPMVVVVVVVVMMMSARSAWGRISVCEARDTFCVSKVAICHSLRCSTVVASARQLPISLAC